MSGDLRKGVLVPLGAHSPAGGSARMDGYTVICSCGWQTSVRYGRSVAVATSKHEQAQRQADHTRHMALVHDQQTHGVNNCGHLCFYPRPRDAAHDGAPNDGKEED